MIVINLTIFLHIFSSLFCLSETMQRLQMCYVQTTQLGSIAAAHLAQSADCVTQGTLASPTVSVVKEICDVEGAAVRPGCSPAEVDDHRSHQVVPSQVSKQSLTSLGVIVGHTQHMAYRRTSLIK